MRSLESSGLSCSLPRSSSTCLSTSEFLLLSTYDSGTLLVTSIFRQNTSTVLSAFFFVQPPMESRITAVSTNIIILFTSSLLYNIVERYTHIKGSALSHHTVSLYSSPMHKNRASCNGKSQTCTANLSRMRLVHAIKSLIDVL